MEVFVIKQLQENTQKIKKKKTRNFMNKLSSFCKESLIMEIVFHNFNST